MIQITFCLLLGFEVFACVFCERLIVENPSPVLVVPTTLHNDLEITYLEKEASTSINHIEKLWFLKESGAGVVAALATLPTSISYASIIGVNPIIGIWTTIILGLTLVAIGGIPGVICGASGVVAVPIASLFVNHGYSYMLAAVFITGIIEASFGILQLGTLVNFVKEPVIAGFLNAFAIFLMKSQFKIFFEKGSSRFLPRDELSGTAFIAGLTFLLINIIPVVLPKTIPSSLLAIVISTAVSETYKLPLSKLRDLAGPSTFTGGYSSLPRFIGFPPIGSLDRNVLLWRVLPTSVGVAMISQLETLLASKITTNTYRKQDPGALPEAPNRACVGLGIGTMLTALFGGFGGCGLIPNTILNGKSGGLRRLSSLICAMSLAVFVVFLAPTMGRIPLAALAGVMLTTAGNTFEWLETIHLVQHASRSSRDAVDCLAMLVTAVICYTVDMGVGVLAGVFVHTVGLAVASGGGGENRENAAAQFSVCQMKEFVDYVIILSAVVVWLFISYYV